MSAYYPWNKSKGGRNFGRGKAKSEKKAAKISKGQRSLRFSSQMEINNKEKRINNFGSKMASGEEGPMRAESPRCLRARARTEGSVD